MPELPEVESIRLMLNTAIIGKTIETITVLEIKQFVGDKNLIYGRSIASLSRKGKYLSIHLNGQPNTVLNIHLKMTGQLIYVADKKNPVIKNAIPKLNTNKLPVFSTRIIFNFSDHSALYYNDIRKFGYIKLATDVEGPTGPDVISSNFSLQSFQTSLEGSKMPIKVFLLDQSKLAGVGNIYANDALWHAKINPLRKAGELCEAEIKTLFEAIVTTIQTGLTYRGASAKDENYILPDGSLGEYQNFFKVYWREHQPCFRDKTPIVRVKQAGRSTFYCPRCQV